MTSLPVQDKPTDLAIYRAYILIKEDDEKDVRDLLNQFGISRGHLYNVVNRVRKGNLHAIRREMAAARLAILWEHKYKIRFQALPKNREAATVKELRLLVRDMERDNFPQIRMAHYLKKDRSTIIHHLRS